MTPLRASFPLLILAAIAGYPTQGRAEAPAILDRARAYLGSEADLAGVDSVHYAGTLTVPDPAHPGQSLLSRIDLVFEKPWRLRVRLASADRITLVGLDGGNAWQEAQDPAGRLAPQARAFGAGMVQELRDETWENLYFYRGIERTGGTVSDLGPATVRGAACERVAFVQPGRVVERDFDRASGRLVRTINAAGRSTRAEGEIVAGGIRFPKTLVAVESDGRGGERTETYLFDRVTVNETFPDSFFAPDAPLAPAAP